MTQNGSAPDKSIRKRIGGLKAKTFIVDEVATWSEPVQTYLTVLAAANSSVLLEDDLDVVHSEQQSVISELATAIQERILEEAGSEGLSQEAYQRKLDEYIGKIAWVW